jgi:integrase
VAAFEVPLSSRTRRVDSRVYNVTIPVTWPPPTPMIRLHDLRHGHASLALAAGVHPLVVSERLGHSSVAFTLDVYSHSVPSLQEDAAQRVAQLVFGG